ncbi:hypothetical protein [Actibacterium sp. 188UL27-1]|uniref:hypothetical protein n=1 Tax=Actibacterium sp. 188UL27-1 TaxID=2786961 RepID=UPI00195889AF|nr:hypothetical protein [Actibacterium sp. 188UL27-1]MBM7066536.1 hypothetical protein [Actibacterium sp. 188UL27-1]
MKKTLLIACAFGALASAASAATVEDVLESCARGAGINSQGITQTAFVNGVSYARLNPGRGVSAERAAAVNDCANRNGGNSAVPPRQLTNAGFTFVPIKKVGCVDNAPYLYRGNLYCLLAD